MIHQGQENRRTEMLKAKKSVSIFVVLALLATGAVAASSAPTSYAADTVKVAAPKNVKAKAGKGKVTVRWKKPKSASGYYIYMAKTKKSGKAGKYRRVKTVKGGAKRTATVNFVDKGKYRIKVKAYRTADGKTYTSHFSKARKVTVKKEVVYVICTCGKKFKDSTAWEKHQEYYEKLWTARKISIEEMRRHDGWRTSTWDIEL
jgi:hypothetical protein